MTKKKRPRSLFEAIMGDFFSDIESIFEKGFEEGFEGSTGYSVQVTYSGDKPIVRVKAFGNVDKSALKSQLQQQYPGAKIIIEDEKGRVEEVSLIKEISEEEKKRREKEKPKKKEGASFLSMVDKGAKKPLIREIDDSE